jgi:hypothetical protein
MRLELGQFLLSCSKQGNVLFSVMIRGISRRRLVIPHNITYSEFLRIDADAVEMMSEVSAAAHDVNAGGGLTGFVELGMQRTTVRYLV